MTSLSHGPPLQHYVSVGTKQWTAPAMANYTVLARDVDTPSVRTHLPMSLNWGQPVFLSAYRNQAGELRVLGDEQLPGSPFQWHIPAPPTTTRLY